MSEQTNATIPFPMSLGVDAMRKGMVDAQERWAAMMGDAAKVEQQGFTHARTMLDESARIAQETLNYWSSLRDEWRRISLDAAKRSVDTLSPR